jgi:hypothetical protein
MIPVCLERQQIITPININQVFLSFIPTDKSKIPRTKKASQIAPGDAKYNRNKYGLNIINENEANLPKEDIELILREIIKITPIINKIHSLYIIQTLIPVKFEIPPSET